MKWLNEMFASMEKSRAVELAKRASHKTEGGALKRVRNTIPKVDDAWEALVSRLASDVAEFNNHKERAGQSAVGLSHAHFRCEVYVPGFESKRMVLTLDNNELHVAVHPQFPKQPSPLTIELDGDGQHGFWLLGENAKEGVKLTAEQLSEYLLKPVLSMAALHQNAVRPTT